jgi:hypothetical protein
VSEPTKATPAKVTKPTPAPPAPAPEPTPEPTPPAPAPNVDGQESDELRAPVQDVPAGEVSLTVTYIASQARQDPSTLGGVNTA